MPEATLPIALIGLRAVGKSTLVAGVARRLGRAALDTDAEIVRLAVDRGLVPGTSDTGAVFRALGQEAFRDLEGEVLADACARRPALVIATGGGAVEREAARAILRHQAVAVWLDAPIEVLAQRMRVDATDRPALFGGDPIAELPQLAARRATWFAEVSRLRLRVGKLDPESTVRAIVEALEPYLARDSN
ncbi:shikimate kinase [Engelhardtia mirabilis]|uniref:Shikimate kinase n=1 Tax=Engelhardtia mirabilis TaxID=2528011 RepID=A0A518BML7_9BACT|nr:Shikimate kinase [Planctomycetes bacterium Pla133]QDV02541.1 Shikimate kinase [Planctomycetes bacterium Pla86]